MKGAGDLRCYPSKRTEDRTEPYSQADGRGKPSSWQRSVKRKLPSSACEPPAQSRKPDNALCTSQGLRPHRHLVSVRKSLSDPLQVFGDCDGNNNNQHRSLSGTNPSDCKDPSFKDQQGKREAADVENLSREKRCSLRPGLKDSTNLDPKVALKQNSLHTHNEILLLKEALCAEKEAHRSLQLELDEERNAASSAANEAMSMIARLQEEKAAVLMEARQFKRMAEERELHNQEAISLLKEMLLNKEEEALALENELVACRQMFLAIEAGEPVQGLKLKYLDIESYGRRNVETEIVYGHIDEGLKSWTSSICDSKQMSIHANDLSKDTRKEKPMTSEFNGRTFGRSLKYFTSDNIRGNLENFFNKAGELTEEMPNLDDVQFKGGVSGMMYDRASDLNVASDMQESSLSFIEAAALSEFQAEPPGFGTDEQTRSLWNRIMKLEHRLETFGVAGQGFEFDLGGNVAATPQTPAFTSRKQQVSTTRSDLPSDSGLSSPQAVDMKKRESGENPRKQSTGGSQQGLEAAMVQSERSEISFRQNQLHGSIGFQGRNFSNVSEQPYHGIDSDMVEGVHDVYEVGYQSYQGSQNGSCKTPGVDSSRKDQPDSTEKPDSPLELMAPVMETMDFTPPDSMGVRNLSSSLTGTEVQQLNVRLQVLENEKHSMHKSILSLQAENKELKTLQAVALQLQELKQAQNLKRNVQTSEQPSKRVKSEQSSFTSILRGFFSYLPSGNSSDDRSMPPPSQDLGRKNRVGLSHLLQKSPHLRTDTLVVRGLKVKVPAAI